VTINVDELSKKDWDKVIRVLSSQALYVAKLLAGEMRRTLKTSLRKRACRSFPQKRKTCKPTVRVPTVPIVQAHRGGVLPAREEFDAIRFCCSAGGALSREELSKRLTAARRGHTICRRDTRNLWRRRKRCQSTPPRSGERTRSRRTCSRGEVCRDGGSATATTRAAFRSGAVRNFSRCAGADLSRGP